MKSGSCQERNKVIEYIKPFKRREDYLKGQEQWHY